MRARCRQCRAAFHLTGVWDGFADCVSFPELAQNCLKVPPSSLASERLARWPLCIGLGPCRSLPVAARLYRHVEPVAKRAFLTFACTHLLSVPEHVQKRLGASFASGDISPMGQPDWLADPRRASPTQQGKALAGGTVCSLLSWGEASARDFGGASSHCWCRPAPMVTLSR